MIAEIPTRPEASEAVFDALLDMLGADGVAELIEIFEVETRRRLVRLAARDQPGAVTRRELHTLKGAAGTVGAPGIVRLATLLEHTVTREIPLTAADLAAMEASLEAFLAAFRARSRAVSE